ncbi:D-alanine--D-alanine ligase family protein [Haloglycomyces albus]|uniref:D-alanine--D-alanine ligase family protein n=1 Tax=Haloglycomyces albus TaxID=526067 RepID=UPI00046CA9FD|nr:D-alanine--D-alanine ligase [Haloglycomyces albus]
MTTAGTQSPERDESGTAVVLAGGMSYEHDISMRSGRRAADALYDHGWHVRLLDSDRHLLESLDSERPDVIVPLLHGAAGEDGALRAVLETMGLPYVGSTSVAARRSWNKANAKDYLHAAKVPVAHSVTLHRQVFSDLGTPRLLDSLVESVGLPLVVKPAAGGSSMGVNYVSSAEELPTALMSTYSYGDEAMVEAFLSGKDVAVTVIDFGDGPRALPAVEAEPLSGTFDFTARYNPGATRWHVPARLDADTERRVGEIAVKAHQALGLRDFSRVDIIVDPQGEITVLEANIAPGMTETSLTPMAIAAADMDFGTTLASLLDKSVTRRA